MVTTEGIEKLSRSSPPLDILFLSSATRLPAAKGITGKSRRYHVSLPSVGQRVRLVQTDGYLLQAHQVEQLASVLGQLLLGGHVAVQVRPQHLDVLGGVDGGELGLGGFHQVADVVANLKVVGADIIADGDHVALTFAAQRVGEGWRRVEAASIRGRECRECPGDSRASVRGGSRRPVKALSVRYIQGCMVLAVLDLDAVNYFGWGFYRR